MHPLRWAAFTAVTLASLVAWADEPTPSPDGPEVALDTDDDRRLYEDDGSLHVLPDHGFPGRRWTQVRAGLSTLGTTTFQQEMRAMGGLRWYWSPALAQDTPAVEAGLMGGAFAGSWGIRETGGITMEAGGNVRFRLLPLDFITPYILVDTTLLWATSKNQLGGRVDLGLGGEFGRILLVEAAFSGVGSRYEVDGDTKYVAIGGAGTISFDFCSVARAGACEWDPPKPELDDQTCKLYDRARELCGHEKASHTNLCAVVDAALDTFEHPLMGRDAVTAFFESALESANAEAARVLNPLFTLHRQQESWLGDGRRATREAVIANEQLAVTRRYAPYPVEIAHALGCDGAKTCEDVCASR